MYLVINKCLLLQTVSANSNNVNNSRINTIITLEYAQNNLTKGSDDEQLARDARREGWTEG